MPMNFDVREFLDLSDRQRTMQRNSAQKAKSGNGPWERPPESPVKTPSTSGVNTPKAGSSKKKNQTRTSSSAKPGAKGAKGRKGSTTKKTPQPKVPKKKTSEKKADPKKRKKTDTQNKQESGMGSKKRRL
jgi:hypothetical protein